MKIANDTLLDIVDIARLAPSVHNTQPWKVHAQTDGISVKVDKAQKLTDGDPTGRQTLISLGIFTQAIIIAAKAKGLEVSSLKFSGDQAHIDFTNSRGSSDSEVGLLKRRSTDRSVYTAAVIPESLEMTLKTISRESNGVEVHLFKELKAIELVSDLTAKGIGLALSNPSFRGELSTYLVEPWSSKRRGISVNSLYISAWLAILQPFLVKRGWVTKQEVALEYKRWLSASGIIIITGKGDLSKYWFETGRTYLRTSLAIEASGLAQATSAAIVEASDYHEDLEKYIGTSDRILAVLRVGNGVKHRIYSPRLTAEEVITSN